MFYVALHEFGHTLGLAHTNVRNAVMLFYYRPGVYDLSKDDIAGIQALYGKKISNGESHKPKTYRGRPRTSTPKPTRKTFPKTTRKVIPKTTKKVNSNTTKKIYPKTTRKPLSKQHPQRKNFRVLCKDPRIDTIFKTLDGKTYIFKGDKYWRFNDKGLVSGYPKKISSTWRGLPDNIDAAFTYENGKTYFFKGSYYWAFSGKVMVSGYPRKISEGFYGIPDDLDAASTWKGSPEVYFYKGSKIWSYNIYTRLSNLIYKNWHFSNVDAVYQHTNGFTYLFKDHVYYKSDGPSLGWPIATKWFGCYKNSGEILQRIVMEDRIGNGILIPTPI